jgi:signal transduction histidine kinase/ligand-binding sensor domain-containing protein/CheY-like chemotaxis protein
MARRFRRVAGLLAAGVAAAASSAAQNLPVHLPAGAPFVAQAWHTRNGLPQNSVADVLQTRDGFVWVGTFGGLCRFDGTTWTVHDTAAQARLGNNRVLSLWEDHDGTLWVGNDRGGITRVRGGTFAPEPGWSGRYVGAIRRLGDGRLLASSEHDVMVLQPEGGWRPFANAAVPAVRDLLEVRGRLLAFGVAGAHDLTGAAPRRLDATTVNGAACAADGTVWLGTTAGLGTLHGDAIRPWPGGPTEPVHAVHVARAGDVWWATMHEVGCLHPSRPERAFTAPTEATLRSIHEDRNGGIWLGFLAHGLVRLQRAEVRPLGGAQGLPGCGQNAVVADGDGGVWVATWNGLFRGRADRFTRVDAVGRMPVAALARGDDGRLWCGLPDEVACLHGDRLERGLATGPGIGLVRALHVVDGELWIGGNGGVTVLRAGRAEPLPLPPPCDRDVHLIADGADGELWVASAGGCVRLDAERRVAAVWRAGAELPAGELRAVLPRAGGRTWLGVYGGGFVAWQRGAPAPAFAVDRRHGLYDHAVCSAVAAGDRVVVGSNLGTYLIDLDELDALADGGGRDVACRPLSGPLDAAAEANGGIQPSACVDGDSVWVCGIDGLLHVPALAVARRVAQPAVHVDRLWIGDQATPVAAAVGCAPGARTIVMRLGACEFDHPEQVRYRWRLLPRGPTWSPPSDERQVQFVVDGPGPWQFEAEAMLAPAAGAMPAPVRVTFDVPALWHERTGPRLALLSLLGGLAWLLFRFGSTRSVAREARLQRRIRQHTGELERAHGLLEQRVQERTAALHAAMAQIEREHAERHHLERSLERLRRMESLGHLAGSVAHDFNNLLTVVLGNAALLELEFGAEGECADLARRIREAGERGRTLTRHLLTVASVQPVAPAPVSLVDEVRRMLGTLRELVGERVRIVTELPARPAVVLGAESQIEQLLLNLCVNARDAMPDGGTLTLAVEVAPPHVVLRVRDTGVGMAPEVRERAFEPFFTTKQRGVGSGLGLATVYGITKQLYGDVELRSGPGEGTEFVFRFPPAPGGAAGEPVVGPGAEVVAGADAGADAAAIVGEAGAASLSVLVAEDEAPVRWVVCRLLESAGCRVAQAFGDGDSAVAWLRDGGVADVVLCDLRMPGTRGPALVDALRAVRPDQPIVFLSGHVEAHTLLGALAERGVELLGKPPESASLHAALQRAVRAVAVAVDA